MNAENITDRGLEKINVENITESDLETAMPFTIMKSAPFFNFIKVLFFVVVVIKVLAIPFIYYPRDSDAYLSTICYVTVFAYAVSLIYHLLYNRLLLAAFVGGNIAFIYNITVCYFLNPAPVIYMFKTLF